MSTQLIRFAREYVPLVFASAILLAACGAPSSAPAPTSAPTSVPAPTSAPVATGAPAPTDAPEPTSAPQAAGVLPAPLYLFDTQQQIVRLETDGQTMTPITHEKQPIMQYSVSPADGALLYILGDRPNQTLVYVDGGGNRTELLGGTLESPVWSPDGQRYAVAWANASDGPGVYSGLVNAGEAVRLVANQPRPKNGARPGQNYTPLAWSPDGKQLLLNVVPDFGPDAPGGDIGVVGRAVVAADGKLTELVRSGGDPYMCLDASWSSNSAQVYCANYGATGGMPALWRVAAAGGKPEVLIASPAEGAQTDVFNARQIGGDLYAFVGTAANGTTAPMAYSMQRLAANGSAPVSLRPDSYDANAVVWAIWSPDGRGAVVQAAKPGATDNALIWAPASGDPPITLKARAMGTPQWGAAQP